MPYFQGIGSVGLDGRAAAVESGIKVLVGEAAPSHHRESLHHSAALGDELGDVRFVYAVHPGRDCRLREIPGDRQILDEGDRQGGAPA